VRLTPAACVMLLALPMLASCQKGVLEGYVDGLRWLKTRTNSQRNGTARFEFEVLPGETSMLVTAEVNEGFQVHVRTLYDSEERPVFKAFDWTGTEYSKTNAGYVSQVSTLNWPVSDEDAELAPGTYTLEFGVVDSEERYVSQPVFIDVLLKADEDQTVGRLNVDIVYTGGLEEDDDLRASVDVAKDHWTELYANIGIDVVFGELAFSSAGDLEPPAFGSADVYSEISAGTGLRTVNVVITPSILSYEEIFGISGDIPGPLISTGRSAVLISADLSAGPNGEFSPEEQRLLAETMAHEVGHYLGLFHPVETTWETWDVLDDTLQCNGEFDCVVELGTNLMFPFPVCSGFSCTPQDNITGEQAGVTHRYTGVE
jgi:predicted Zn-dependent protease